MDITIHTGRHDNQGLALLDNQHPELQMQEFKELLLANETIFSTNSQVILGYVTCLLKHSKISAPISDQYPIRLESITVIEHNIDGTSSLLANYHGLPSDDNILNNAIAKFNNDFSELQLLKHNIINK